MSRSRWHSGPLVLGAALYAFGAVVPHSYAQIATAIRPDGTLGTSVMQSGNLYGINGGTIKGNNQFHSFDRFSVGTGDIASFNGPAGIQNIVSRVTGLLTGPAVSQIDGTIASTISGANLFLLNPAGIMFGPNAQLNISGSFHATTADYIKLGNDGIFYADPAQPTVLSVAPPSAFGFLTPTPAPIDVQAGVFDPVLGITNVLQVPAGQTLSFVGGSINIGAAPGAFAGGFVFAPGGRINLVSVASPGEARFDGTGFSVDTFARLGDIGIKGNSVIDGKEVFIRGGRLVIEGGDILPGFFFLNGLSGDPPNGGEVNIQTSDSVTIKGPPSDLNGFSGILTFAGNPVPGDVPHVSIKSSSVSLSEGGLVQTVRQGPGNPANVSIEADTVEVLSGASVAALNFFQGPGGTLTVNARNVTLDSAGSDQFTGLSAQAFFNGDYGLADETGSFAKAFLPSFQFADSGSITVNAAGTLTMRGSAQISTDSFAFGKSGNVTVNAGDMLLVGAGANTGLISAQSRLAGRPGDVTINATGSIDMQNGFRISANTLGSDDAGQVNVRAGQSITMTGTSTFISSVTGQPVDSELDSFAVLFFPFFQSTRGIEVLDYPSLRTALGVAPSPNDLMNVLAALSTISDGAGNPLVAVTKFTPGNGGKVSITTPVLAVNDGAHIETSTVWDGNAGAIALDVGSLTLRDGAIIGSRSGAVRPDRGFTVGTGNAGTVNIAATDTVEISGRSPTSGQGSIVTTTTFGDGNAGNISLSANQINVQNGGSVTSASGGTVNGQLFVGTGNAGQITVSTPTLTMGDGSTISVATAGAGKAGDIGLTVANISLAGGARVDSSTTAAGSGGAITLTTTDVASGASINGTGSGLFSTAASTGNAGTITVAPAPGVQAPMLTMADGGRISVATSGAGRAGDITLTLSSLTSTGGARVDSSTTGAGQGGNVALTATGPVALSGVDSTGAAGGLFSTTQSSGDAGQIQVSTPQLTLGGGAQIASSSLGASTTGRGGSVTVTAPTSVALAGAGSGVFSTAEGVGDAGTITVTTPTLSLSDGSTISVATAGAGKAGDIGLTLDTFSLAGGARIDSSTTGAGRGGNVALSATSGATLTGTGGGLFSTAASTGNAGTITVATPTLTMGDGGTISVATSGSGNAGNILLNAANFTQAGGATVNSSTTAEGAGGAITLTTTDAASSVSIAGAGSGLFSTASSTGDAGQITVASATGVPAPTLELKDGGAISVATSGAGRAGDIALTASSVTLTGGARVDSSTTGAGRGGIVTVNAAGPATISSGAGLFSTAAGSGAGGDLNIRAAELQLLDGAIISANSSGTDTALAGNVNIVAGSLFRMANSTITTQAAVADGGNISITTTGSLVHLTDSQITTSVQSGVGSGGNITIGSTLHPSDFILLDASQVRADAFGGPGGNINIFANVYLTTDSVVSASSALSTPGTINIQASITNVSGSLTQLPTSPLEAAALLRASCAARLAGGKSSSLVLAGREGLPLDPGGLLPSPLVVEEPAVATLSLSEEYSWLEKLLRVSQLSLDPNCSK